MEGVQHIAFALNGDDGDMLTAHARSNIVVKSVFTVADGRDLKHIFGTAVAGVIGEFGEGAFLFADIGEDLPFQHDLGIGRHHQIRMETGRHFQRFPEEPGDGAVFALIVRNQRHGTERDIGMHADDDGGF